MGTVSQSIKFTSPLIKISSLNCIEDIDRKLMGFSPEFSREYKMTEIMDTPEIIRTWWSIDFESPTMRIRSIGLRLVLPVNLFNHPPI